MKAALLVIVSLCFKIGTTPPNPPATTTDKVYKGQLYESASLFWALLSWVVVMSLGLSNAIALLSLEGVLPYSAEILPHLCPHGSPAAYAAMPELTAPFLVGAVLTVLGAALRVWCFRTLGQFFTFEVTARKGHKLVITGPYAIVRHPSYIAIYIMLVGSTLVSFTPGSHIVECGVMFSRAGWAVGAALLSGAWGAFAMYRRSFVEDGLMKEMFGEQWLRYRDRVPYRFIPGVY